MRWCRVHQAINKLNLLLGVGESSIKNIQAYSEIVNITIYLHRINKISIWSSESKRELKLLNTDSRSCYDVSLSYTRTSKGLIPPEIKLIFAIILFQLDFDGTTINSQAISN